MSRATLAGLAALVAAVAGCGAGEEGPGGPALAWVKEPSIVRAATGGSDRVVIGEVRNDSDEFLKLLARRIEVRDSDGRALESDARYTSSYLHGLYGADVKPGRLPAVERRRLGLEVLVEPGGTAPLYAAFRERRAMPPLSLDWGSGSLPIPPLGSDD